MPSLPAPADDGDALPAVGKVYEGPKKSLSEILAADAARKRQPPTPDRPPGPTVQPELAEFWPRFLEAVKEQLGMSQHVPLLSGEPRREGGKLVIRFAGPFASLVRYLEKYRDPMQQIAQSVIGEEIGLQFEADASAPAPVPAQPQGRAGGASSHPADAAMAQVAARDGIPLTPELRSELEKDPLIRSIMQQFNASIVKVEQSEEKKNV